MKFKPDVDMYFDGIEQKYRLVEGDILTKNSTFCFESQLLSVLINENKIKTFLITENQSFWGYAYNLLFEAIDFDTKESVWLCKVLGYIE